MARAFASTLLDAPVEAVWAMVRDFNGLPDWNPAVRDSSIEGGLASDVVGCVRAFTLSDGTFVRERLLSLDDSRYSFTYNFETPAFPVDNYLAGMELIPETKSGRTYVQWWATFDETPEDAGRFTEIVSRDVFAAGLAALAEKLTGASAPAGAERWQGLRPAKVFTSSTITAPVETVWAKMRDFAGMGGWHEDITKMHMLDGARSDKVSGVRDFLFGEGLLWEQLTYLSDTKRAFRYRILKSPMPWLNYHAGARLYPVTDRDHTFAVWTADWTAAPQDDLELIPNVHGNVFQKAFDTLEEQLGGGAG
ncbi:SRPBCC family protein [Stappia sp. TSB10P1A]|uniref:SRPBCC family protein n=1 Tax=Stappia sp. TSB10P1A TaxID=2003585 RepID=UPI0016438FA6|nr:SRPBCC family protein [Stappia sp. TSB10P1A]